MFPTLHVGEGAVYTSSSPIPTSLHIISCQHTAASDDIHINNCNFSLNFYDDLENESNRSETCAYVTPRALSIELNVLGIWTECLFVQSLFVCLFVFDI